LILIGSRDPFLDVCRRFQEEGRRRGARIEMEVYERQPHAFFNHPPWFGKTLQRAERFLRELGYISE